VIISIKYVYSRKRQGKATSASMKRQEQRMHRGPSGAVHAAWHVYLQHSPDGRQLSEEQACTRSAHEFTAPAAAPSGSSGC
jgi:hypothetical protein